ncbi:MAG TPA: TCP-1/cpn60 chaperonin family protein, partial [Candidatus Bathyarchaeia archaeon]|nr:TCP-1/cpn60 chaperonin family protein [Candidatus Bathyarchaeia archaeon]
AVEATKAALEQGIVPGGGIALLNESVKLSEKSDIAAQILAEALSMPAKQIAANSGQSPERVVSRVQDLQKAYEGEKMNPNANWNMGYNAEENTYVDMLEAGIIDPTKVVISALTNAVSAAAMLLTTEAVVTDIPEKKEKGMPSGMPGMGGMDMGM